MPTLISETDVRLEPADLLRRVRLDHNVDPTTGFIVPPRRARGLHLSGLLRYIAETSKITARVQEVAEEEHPLRWALGQAWEEFAASLYPQMVWQPGEMDEPVIMNCDGITVDDPDTDGSAVIDEFKFNRAKKYRGSDLLEKKWLWKNQGLGYCVGYGFRYVRWHVLSAFEFPDPIYTKYLYRFSLQEINSTANMICNNMMDAFNKGYAE